MVGAASVAIQPRKRHLLRVKDESRFLKKLLNLVNGLVNLPFLLGSDANKFSC
jgi:hypothetical protein